MQIQHVTLQLFFRAVGSPRTAQEGAVSARPTISCVCRFQAGAGRQRWVVPQAACLPECGACAPAPWMDAWSPGPRAPRSCLRGQRQDGACLEERELESREACQDAAHVRLLSFHYKPLPNSNVNPEPSRHAGASGQQGLEEADR